MSHDSPPPPDTGGPVSLGAMHGTRRWLRRAFDASYYAIKEISNVARCDFMLNLPHLQVLRRLSRDGRLLFATRCARLFGYGLFSVVLVLYLHAVGLSEDEIGLLLLLTLL